MIEVSFWSPYSIPPSAVSTRWTRSQPTTERGSSPSTQPSARIGKPISVNRNATWTTSPASAAPDRTRPTPTSSTASTPIRGSPSITGSKAPRARLTAMFASLSAIVGPVKRSVSAASRPSVLTTSAPSNDSCATSDTSARSSCARVASGCRVRWKITFATKTSGKTRQPTSASQTSAANIAAVAKASIAITPIAIGSGAITNQIDSTSAFAFESSCPVGCRWCHSSGSFRYCRVTRRRYVAWRRNCITPAPIRRPTTPIARSTAMPRNSETSDASAPKVVSPRSRAGRIT